MATSIKSKEGLVSKSQSQLYMLFVDLRNFLQFIPEDKKKDIHADYDYLAASVQGFSIGVKVEERLPYSCIRLKNLEGTPFSFNIALNFQEVPSEPNKTLFNIEIDAELNFMMKMLLGGKLKEGLDKIVDTLVDVSNGKTPPDLPEDWLKNHKNNF